MVGTWQRDQRRAGVRILLQALAESRIGRRDQAQAWVWRLAEFTRDCHEEYAVARWPETKRLLGLFVNSSGRAHGKNARRLVQAARGQDRRLAVALLAAAVAHTPEAEEVLRGARMRMARKPSAVARELLRNLPKAGGKKRRRRSKRSREGENGANGPRRTGRSRRPRRDRGGRRDRGAADRRRRRSSPPRRRSRPATTPSPTDRVAQPSAQADLAGAERDRLAAAEPDEQVAALVDALGDAAAPARLRPALPADLAAAQERRGGGTRPGRARPARPPTPPGPRRARARSSATSTACPSEVAGRRRSSGNSASAIETFTPTPITAQSGGRASISTPASLRSSSQTSLGHLISHSTGASDSQAAQTATGTASGSSRCSSPSGRRIAE